MIYPLVSLLLQNLASMNFQLLCNSGYLADWYRVGIEKNNANELTFCSYAREQNDNTGTLSFTWIMQLNQADTMRLKAIEEIHCATSAKCIFSGKFIRSI